MPLRVGAYQTTPNPLALKCVVEGGAMPGTGREGLRSYTNKAGARGDELAMAFFDVAGVRNVLIHASKEADQPGWISIGKAPEAAWKPIKAGIERVLAQYGESPVSPPPTSPPTSPHGTATG
jgi:hypothetical protein